MSTHPRTLFYDSEDSDAHYNDFQYWKDSLSNVDEEDVRSVTAGDSSEGRQRRRRKRPATKRRPVRPLVFGLTSEEEEEEGEEKRDEMEGEGGFSGPKEGPERKEEGVPEEGEEKRDEMEEEAGFSGPQDGLDRKKEGEPEQEVSKQLLVLETSNNVFLFPVKPKVGLYSILK
jgi:hypothetical protein